jgi:nitroreductase
MISNFESTPEQYRNLLARTSCRRFDSAPLDEETLQTIQQGLSNIESLQNGNRIKFHMLNKPEKSQLAVAQGAYGRFIVSSHLMIPYIEKSIDSLVELGFQSQQAVILLQNLGLGSCYVGAHGRVHKLQHEFAISDNAHLAAVLIYGKPAGSEIYKNLNQSYRSLIGSRKRKAIEEILLEPIPPGNALSAECNAILEGGRWAPSATNAQPWRLLPIDGEFQLFTNPAAYPIVLNAGSKLMYALYDAGIFMANILLAARAFNIPAKWTLEHQTHIPNQKALLPIARLSFK